MTAAKWKTARGFVCIAIVLMLISMIGASLIQTSGSRVKMSEVTWATTIGYNMTAYLLVPDNATAETPAPAVVTCHGLLNNKEMQDLNYVELARRGYVVLAIDMISHGDSDIASTSAPRGQSVYEGVLFLKDVPYVDAARIGITGHSAGSASCNTACATDNANESRLIAAALINSSDPVYVDGEGNFANVYGSRDVGVVAGQYDEFGFKTIDNTGAEVPRPEYIHGANAQSFLHYGQDPAGLEERQANTIYTETVDGEEAIRVIYNPNFIHPWSHFSKRASAATIEFFEAALGAPNSINPSNQVWQWKVVFNAIGLVGFFMFVVNFAIALLDVPFFAPVASKELPAPLPAAKGTAQIWFWISLVIGAIYGAASYLPILNALDGMNLTPTLFGQSGVFGVSMWAASCGVVTLICLFVGSKVNKDSSTDFAAVGIKISGSKLLRTVILAAAVVICSYGWVFLADCFFHTDFRIWVFAAKAFNPIIIRLAIPFMIIISVFYILSSISVNCFNYRRLAGKEWLNTAVLAFFTGLPAMLVCALQYFYFWGTGHLMFDITTDPQHLFVVWLFPLLSILPLSVVISRKIYKATGNPYLPGLINAIIIALISSANTVTVL